MPTNYTADPSQTRAPSPKPKAGGLPVLQLPVDGEATAVASVYQAFQVLADWMGFSLSPRANPSQWVEALIRWRSALGQTRFAVDHMGFPAGRIYAWDETWGFAGGQSGDGDDVALRLTGDPWFYKAAIASPGGAGGGTGFGYPGSASPLIPTVDLLVGHSAGDRIAIARRTSACWHPTLAAAYDFQLRLEEGSGLDDVEYFAGLSTGTALPRLTEATDYAAFRKVTGNSTWQVATRGGSGSELVNDTGVSTLDSWHAARIEYHGADVSDDGNAAVCFYVDGVLVARHTTELPATGVGPTHRILPHFSILRTTLEPDAVVVGFPDKRFYIGPCSWRSNLYAADVL